MRAFRADVVARAVLVSQCGAAGRAGREGRHGSISER
jgi:hypothetical protein